MTLGWGALGIPAATGVLVVLLVWLVGPGLFTASAAQDEQVARATVDAPVSCTDAGVRETVRVTVDGSERMAELSACGHTQGEQVDVVVPSAPGEGELDVRLSDTERGNQDARRPVGMFLVAVSCAAGGAYAFLMVRGRRLRA
ncbi:hypothetical protein CFN78_03205 [Amycolatopsis antarctica]|uniref:Uncharacterized protein n=1 Tax=Amycolatopsis antarctica TaxID=1854586 RepID=A0A263DA33_9PSEU|nr:hypothetical protein CFN78_03205 [Amycolatopsis antarctica]